MVGDVSALILGKAETEVVEATGGGISRAAFKIVVDSAVATFPASFIFFSSSVITILPVNNIYILLQNRIVEFF